MENVQIIRKSGDYWPGRPIKQRIETSGNIQTIRIYNEYSNFLESLHIRNIENNILLKYESYSANKYIVNDYNYVDDGVYHITEKYLSGIKRKPLLYKSFYCLPSENNILDYRKIKHGEYKEYHLDRLNNLRYRFNYENNVMQGFQYTYAKTGKLIRIEYYWNGKNLTRRGRSYSNWPNLDEMQLMHLKLSV